MSSVEEELWNIFTFYALHGNARDPEHLKLQQFVRFCTDCDILKRRPGVHPLKQADINLVFTAEIKSKTRRTQKKDMLTYSDWLNCLMKIAPRLHPRSPKDSVFHQLLMENVLPLASRRQPEPFTEHLKDPEVQDLLDQFADALQQIFLFYADLSERRKRKEASHMHDRATRAAARAGAGVGQLPPRASVARPRSRFDEPIAEMHYAEYQRFMSDYRLNRKELVSALQAGDIYLCSIKPHEGADQAMALTEEEFHEVLLRVARMAFSRYTGATQAKKLQQMMLEMWKAVNNKDATDAAVHDRSNLTAYAGDLNIHGSSLFNRTFYGKWRADGFIDYLSKDPPMPSNVEEVLTRILERPAPRPVPGSKAYGSALPEGEQTQDELDELLARRPSVMAILQAELDDDAGGGGGGDGFLAPLDDE